MSTYLLTGGTGFLGSHLIPLLLATEGVAGVVLFVRDAGESVRARWASEPRVTLAQGSLGDVEALARAARGCAGVFHLAGLVLHSRYEAGAVYDVNVQGTLNVMRAAKLAGVRKVVYASSSGVVACQRDGSEVATDSSALCRERVARWPYYASKVEAEELAAQFARENDMCLVSMRPTMMLGPGDERFRSTHTVVSFLQRKLPLIPSGGASFVDIRDAAAAFLQAMLREEASGPYLLGACNCTLLDFFDMLQRVSGVKKPLLRYVPGTGVVWVASALDWINRNVRGKWDASVDPVRAEMGCHFWNLDSSRAKRELGFRPRDPETTLRDTVRWITQHHEPRIKVMAKL